MMTYSLKDPKIYRNQVKMNKRIMKVSRTFLAYRERDRERKRDVRE